ncbi:MAG: hypothetical protein IJ189_12210 [Clostridia bacterium]|nr:hypothetical protein [Clostridia bacterium]
MKRWSAAAFGALAGAMLVYPGEAAEAAWQGMMLWARAVAPVLGPFMACMLMITSRLSGGPWLRVALSWLGGSPGGARLMQGMNLTGRDAVRYAAMTGTMSPMFFLGTVSAWLGDAVAGRIILLCHIAGALLLGLCVKKTGDTPAPACQPMPLGTALRESALALLTVALCMMLGCVAARMASCAFPELPPSAAAALQCALEVTAGVKALIEWPGTYTAPLVCAACSFGGLSLLLQNAAFWQDSGVTLSQLFFLRLLHAMLSGALCFLVFQGLTSVVY